jgi:hypothetical protein
MKLMRQILPIPINKQGDEIALSETATQTCRVSNNERRENIF